MLRRRYRVPMRRVFAAITACVALTVIPGCGSSSNKPAAVSTPASPSPSVIDAGQSCPSNTQGAKPVHFTSGDVQLAGDEWGNGRVGIVFAHESNVDSCVWMPYAAAAAKLGYRTLTFDFSGYGSSPQTRKNTLTDDVASAASFLRSEGASKIVL